jgi:hypothetical protein
MLRVICLSLSWLIALSAIAQPNPANQKHDPKDALGWFERASEQLNLRALGSAPFHMKVSFHAFPGVELLPAKEKSEFAIGDGIYEETWLSPQQWRREVTLGSYHAVETHSDRVRKMQASSEYEPSRVIMLIEALLNPIAHYVLSPDLRVRHFNWKMDRSTVGDHTLMRISASKGISSHINEGSAYVFLSGGLLVQSNENDIVTTFQDDVVFAGRVVPRHISIQAGAVRDLLTADVVVERAGDVDPSVFELPGEPAEAGMTLRPLTWYADKFPEIIKASGIISQQETYPDMIMHGIVDRHGAMREFEVIYMQGIVGATAMDTPGRLVEAARQYKFHPAEIDGSPCESTYGVFQTRH